MKHVHVVLSAVWGWRYDLCVQVGGTLIAVGIGFVYWPAGVIAAGVALAVWGLIGARTIAIVKKP